MSDVQVSSPTPESVRLWVIPEEIPEQQALPADERDVTIASKLGAVWGPDKTFMVPGENCGVDDIKKLKRLFGTLTAERLASGARERLGVEESKIDVREHETAVPIESGAVPTETGDGGSPGASIKVDRFAMARAANAEVVRRGGMPVREIPSPEDLAGKRYYLFTAREAESPYNYKKLDDAAKELGINLLIDKDEGSKYYGLRFAVGSRPTGLEHFATKDAYDAHVESRRKRDLERERMAAAAMLEFWSKNKVTPLTVPDRKTDPDGYEKAVKALNSMGSKKLAKLMGVTESERKKVASLGEMMAAGIGLATEILEERRVRGIDFEERNAAESAVAPRETQRDSEERQSLGRPAEASAAASQGARKQNQVWAIGQEEER